MYDRGILGRISEPLNFQKFLCIVCSYFSCLCFILDIFSWYRCQLHCMLLPYAKKKYHYNKTTFFYWDHNETLGITEICFVQGVWNTLWADCVKFEVFCNVWLVPQNWKILLRNINDHILPYYLQFCEYIGNGCADTSFGLGCHCFAREDVSSSLVQETLCDTTGECTYWFRKMCSHFLIPCSAEKKAIINSAMN